MVEALELDVMLVAVNALLTQLPARNALKALCDPAKGQLPVLFAV